MQKNQLISSIHSQDIYIYILYIYIYIYIYILEHKSSFDTFFNFLFWIIWTCLAVLTKTIMQTFRNFDFYLHAINELHC